jgi:hypothetical protein
MDRLSVPVSRSVEQRQRNSAAMSRLIDRLDEQLFTPSPEAIPSRDPSMTSTRHSETRDDDPIPLPPRRDPRDGGDFGASIRAAVARNYGIG